MTDVVEVVRRAGNVPRNAWSDTPEGRATRERAFSTDPKTAPRSRFPRLPALVAAAVVIGLSIGVAAVLTRPSSEETPAVRPAEGTPVARPLTLDRLVHGSWVALDPPPGLQDAQLDAVWTGDAVLTIDATTDRVAVASLDPRTGRWTTVAAPPLSPRFAPSVEWTGSKLLVWGGSSVTGAGLLDGAAYDPLLDSWTLIPPAPLLPRRASVTVWTGREFVVLGGDTCLDTMAAADCSVGPDLQRGAAYDPRTEVWRPIAPAPVLLSIGASAAVVRREAVVFGWAIAQSGLPASVSLAYDPAGDRWRTLPAQPSVGGAATRLHDSVVTFALRPPRLSANRLDPATGTWTSFGSAELDSVCDPATAIVRGDLVAGCPGGWVRLVPGSGVGPWTALPSPPTLNQMDELLWTGRELIAVFHFGQVFAYRPSS
jgi:hypothetical protein